MEGMGIRFRILEKPSWIAVAAIACASYAAHAGPVETPEQLLKRYSLDPKSLSKTAWDACDGHYGIPAVGSADMSRAVPQLHAMQAGRKRDLLIEYAVAFAAIYHDKHEVDQIFHQQDEQKKAAGNAEDWCAKFATTLVNLVDQATQDDPLGVPSTLDYNKSRGLAPDRNLISAYRLLDLFGPSAKRDRNLYCAKDAGPNCKIPEKRTWAFRGPNQAPVPGCLAVYMDPKTKQGHIALVVGISSSDMMTTIEGNTSDGVAGDDDSTHVATGIYQRTRLWGANRSLDGLADKGTAAREKVYQGCVLPWSGMQYEEAGECSKRISSEGEFLFKNLPGPDWTPLKSGDFGLNQPPLYAAPGK